MREHDGTSPSSDMSPGGDQPETTDAELQSSEAAVRGVFDQATIGMAILEPSGHFSRVNRAYCQYLGYTAGELLKRHFDIVIHPECLARKELSDFSQL